MTLKILGAGFGRTGTNSLRVALGYLGYNTCYHMFEVKENPEHVHFWNQAYVEDNADWECFFKSYHAAVDWPAAAFWKQITSAFPQVKIIVTVRDPDEWYESVSQTIFKTMTHWEHFKNIETQRRLKMAKRIILDGIFSGQYGDKAHCLAIYQHHIEKVRETIPPGKFLEYNVSEGWDTLCEFLNKDSPDISFPHTNTRESFFKYAPQ
jgi:hypothetical protein